MTVLELKEYIYKHNKIEFVLNSLGCHKVKYHPDKDYYSAAFKDGDNPSGIVISNNKWLNFHSYSRTNDFKDKSDIFTLIEYTNKISFVSSVKYLHKLLGIEYKYHIVPVKKDTDDLCEMGVELLLKHKYDDRYDEDMKILDKERLNWYIPILYIGWLREGIVPSTANKFDIAYSYEKQRVIIPHKYWLTGELVGINARTVVENYKELNIKKYWLTPSYRKSLNVYGLYEHYEGIKKKGYVTVFEGEKSVLKRDVFGDETGVAVSGKNISDEQVRILLGLNVEIVIAFDKDVKREELRFICSKFYPIKRVSYIYDEWGILKDKQSPCDRGNKVYNALFSLRVRYDEKEHEEYLKFNKERVNK